MGLTLLSSPSRIFPWKNPLPEEVSIKMYIQGLTLRWLNKYSVEPKKISIKSDMNCTGWWPKNTSSICAFVHIGLFNRVVDVTMLQLYWKILQKLVFRSGTAHIMLVSRQWCVPMLPCELYRFREPSTIWYECVILQPGKHEFIKWVKLQVFSLLFCSYSESGHSSVFNTHYQSRHCFLSGSLVSWEITLTCFAHKPHRK